MAMPSMDLTTKALVKVLLGITDTNSDTVIDALITPISDAVEKDLGRTFASATYIEYRDGDHVDQDTLQGSMFLRNWPITSITSIYDDVNRSFGSDTLIAATNYSFVADSGELIFTIPVYRGKKNLKITYVSGYAPVAALPPALEYAVRKEVAATFLESKTNMNQAQGHLDGSNARAKQYHEDAKKLFDTFRRVGYGF